MKKITVEELKSSNEKKILLKDVKGTPFDDTFRTLLERCRKLIIPVINEVFGTDYSVTDEVELLSNEHFIVESKGISVKRITDSCIKVRDRLYHIECESNSISGIEIRMMEYDFHIALSGATNDTNGLTLKFPHSAVLYLRDSDNTPDMLKINLVMPDEKIVSYEVKTVKVQKYTKEEIFDKDLLFFIPFYVLKFEKKLSRNDSFLEIKNEFREEYEDILNRLKSLEKMKYIDYNYLSQLITLTKILITIVSKNNPNVAKEVDFMGGGQVIDAQAVLLEEMKKTWYRAGVEATHEQAIEEGREQGIEQNLTENILLLLESKGEIVQGLMDKIKNENDIDRLKDWYKLAIKVSSVNEFELLISN
ncbi:MAG: hypothetical protein UF228_10570 [Lachnospiraceae bacterium]|nr:hypothetical protein [Lachnospiraceae bacterium]